MKKGGLDSDCLRIGNINPNKLTEYEILAIGAPAQVLGTSKPTNEFLKKL
jgi:hypothetical protein